MFGNGKGHRIPLFNGLRVEKLLCIGDKRYKVLKKEIGTCLWWEIGRSTGSEPEQFTAGEKTRYRPHSLSVGGHKSLAPPNSKASLPQMQGVYQPTDIWATRESSFWQWHRVYEWFSEFKDFYENEGRSQARRAHKIVV
jgi:hypothetical protein